MLLKIREKTQSWLAWVIVGLISIPFALFGIQSYFSTSTDIVVAEINNVEILLPEYQRAFSDYKYRIRQFMQKDYNPSMVETDKTKKSILDDLVKKELLRQYISDAGFNIPDKIIINQITSIPSFQMDGQFNADVYKQIVNAQGMSKKGFENKVRLDLMQQQLQDSFNQFALITNNEIHQIELLQNQTRKVSLLKIPVSKIRVNQIIKPDELQKFYEENKHQYINPEALKLNFVELSSKLLAKKIKINDEELKNAYEKNKTTLLTNELRNFSHIMLLINKGESDKKYQRKINKLYKELKQGANFSKLAKQKSEDLGSSAKGGRLGFVAKGDMDSAITDVLFKMKEGEISLPVRSKFGYHILKLNKIKKPEIKTFKEAKDELLKSEQLRKAQELFAENAEYFSNLSYEKPNSLEPLVEELNLEIQTSKWVTRKGGNGIFGNQKVLDAIFNNTVMLDKQNSDIVELSDDDFIVFRMIEHRKQAFLPLDKVKNKIKKSIINQRKKLALREKGTAFLKKLQTGTNKNQVARLLGLRWGKTKTYNLKSTLSKKIKDAIFATKKPSDGEIVYQGVSGNQYTIIALKQVDYNIKKSQKNAIKNKMKQALNTFHYDKFIQQLKNNGNVSVFYPKILDNQ